MDRKERTKKELIEASNHLNYEFWMLNSLSVGLASGLVGQGPLQNALIESFVIHMRALIDFLYSKNPKNDEVIAEDYFLAPDEWLKLRPDISDMLRKASIRAHKEIAHLTYERQKVTPETKPWHFVKINNEINNVFKIFLENVNLELLGEQWKLHHPL